MRQDADEPATKRDLEEALEKVQTALEGLKDELIEESRKMQTEVLRAFHNWARPIEVKNRSHEERLTLLEERISEIERGLQRPHQ